MQYHKGMLRETCVHHFANFSKGVLVTNSKKGRITRADGSFISTAHTLSSLGVCVTPIIRV